MPSPRVTLARLLAGNRPGAEARALLAVCAAFLGVVAVILAAERLTGDGAPAPAAERLLLEVENTGAASSPLVARVPTKVPPAMRRAIAHAALAVGVDRGYLLAVAARESGFDAKAYAPESSAAGLYQFTEDTWLRVVKVFGARHGLGAYVASIAVRDDGGVTMAPGPRRERLMRLRFDPRLAAVMAAELAQDNERRLAHVLGRPVSPAETYIAHFLGLRQAARIIDAAASRPHQDAARLVPAAAASNPAIFGTPDDPASARTVVREIEAYFRDEVPRFDRV
ncbi:MAG TPA: transglycosylase SLT domain-containing protein [Stellaceae bacterium]|nr:transglycosylase SLT domain-containing protein [Stellaceae bacterium]